ncbi:MAG TPA: GNAT family N-acetyltransferase [Puia sp.]|jgi:ribosomal protein S18 acetylase RimI-like enzyme
MNIFQFRKAIDGDIIPMAQIRDREWGTEDYWITRIGGYMRAESHPQHALIPRIIFVAEDKEKIIGFIAGHLTTRLGCNGELEWINVIPEYRKNGVASQLLHLLAKWFAEQNAFKVCIDVAAENIPAQKFYRKHGAKNLDAHWLYWEDVRVIMNNEK